MTLVALSAGFLQVNLPSYNLLRLLLYSFNLQNALLYRCSYRYLQRYCRWSGSCIDPFLRCKCNNKLALEEQQLNRYQQACFGTDNLGTCSLIDVACICGSSAITQVACCVLSSCSQADIDSKFLATMISASS